MVKTTFSYHAIRHTQHVRPGPEPRWSDIIMTKGKTTKLQQANTCADSKNLRGFHRRNIFFAKLSFKMLLDIFRTFSLTFCHPSEINLSIVSTCQNDCTISSTVRPSVFPWTALTCNAPPLNHRRLDLPNHPPNIPNQAHANKPKQSLVVMHVFQHEETNKKSMILLFLLLHFNVPRRVDNLLSFDNASSHLYSDRSYGSVCSFCYGCGYDYGRSELFAAAVAATTKTMADGTHAIRCNFFRASKRIQECGCHCSADDYTTATANITQMVPIRRHTTTLVHPFHHHRPHSCNCPLPIHFMLRCGLFITTDILTQERHFSAKRRRRNTHLTFHRSAPCGKAPHVGHHQFNFFRTPWVSGVTTRHARTPNHNDGARHLSVNC